MKTIARRLSPFAILLPASLLSACASLGNAGLGGSQQNPTNQLLNMIDEATREGMSVVLVPALMPNKSVTDLSSYSHRVIFKNKDVPGIAYMQAFANNDLERSRKPSICGTSSRSTSSRREPTCCPEDRLQDRDRSSRCLPYRMSSAVHMPPCGAGPSSNTASGKWSRMPVGPKARRSRMSLHQAGRYPTPMPLSFTIQPGQILLSDRFRRPRP